jgi:hypothetical protein
MDRRQVNVTAPGSRALLVVLALEAGRRSQSTGWLLCFGFNLPDHPRRAVQTQLTRLRSVLGVTPHTAP